MLLSGCYTTTTPVRKAPPRVDYTPLVRKAAYELADKMMYKITPNTGADANYQIDYASMVADETGNNIRCYVYITWTAKVTRFNSRRHDCRVGGWLYISYLRNVTYVVKEESEAVRKCEIDGKWRRENTAFSIEPNIYPQAGYQYR